MKHLLIAWLCVSIAGGAIAANEPCSGSKGGIDRCEGAAFICKDGSQSGSKRHCLREFGGKGAAKPAGDKAHPSK